MLGSIKRRKQSASAIRSQLDVPQLPNDVMLMIFKALKTDERIPLETSCNRFRDIDTFLRKPFDSFEIETVEHGISVTRKPKHIISKLVGNAADPVFTKRIEKFFRKPKANIVKIIHHEQNGSKCDHININWISGFMKKIESKKIKISVHCNPQCANFFINTLIYDNKQEYSQVCLSLEVYEPANEANDDSHMRRALMQLRPTDKFKLNWSNILENDYEFIVKRKVDDSLLMHFISMSNHSEFARTSCTAQGMLNAFETVGAATGDKFVYFIASEESTDELLAMPNRGYAKGADAFGRWIRDDVNRTILLADDDHWTREKLIRIGKTDEDGKIVTATQSFSE